MVFYLRTLAACLILALVFCQKICAQGDPTLDPILKDGIRFATADKTFALTLRFRVQSRVGYLSKSLDDLTPKELDFRIRRMRLRLDGHVLDPRLRYQVQLSFSRADQDWDISQVPNVLRDAMLWYSLSKNITIGMGQGKLPGNRQRVISSGEQQFADRSIVNNALTLDRDMGVFLNYAADNENFAFRLKTAITSGEGRNALPSDKGLAYTGRLEILPFGTFTGRNDYVEGDVEHEPRLKAAICGTIHSNDRAVRTGGQLGLPLYESRDLLGAEADVVVKYRGWALSSEYLYRYTDTPATYDSNQNIRFVTAGEGINTQLSYCTTKMWELALRHSLLVPQRELFDRENNRNQYGICVSKYLNKHRVKMQTDLTYERLQHPETGVKTGDSLQWRFQVELGI
ncbi:MAG: porin [Saprospiraceae bacterium]